MSYISFRYRGRFVSVYDLNTQPSRLHSQRAMLDAIRKHDPFQNPSKFR